MRLLWLSHLVPYPPKGGALQRAHYLLREAALRHEVDLVALAQPAHQTDEAELSEARDALAEICGSVKTFWIQSDRRALGRERTLARSLFSLRPFDANWLEEPELAEHLRRMGRRHDLVHVDTVGLTPYLSVLPGAPFVLDHHNVESHMMDARAATERNPLKRLFMRREADKLARWERRWAGRAAVNVVVSALDADRLRERAGDVAVEVVPNGVDTEYFRPRTAPEDHDGSLVFVGGMSWYPNRDAVRWFVREIWPLLLRERPDRRAALIGRDPPDEVLRAAEDQRLEAPGFVPDVRPTMDRAMAYVCPIREGGGTRLKVLDALAMAKPLVATGFAVEGLDLAEGTHYLRAESPQDYLRQIARLEASPALCGDLGRAGRSLVEERFAWEVVGERLEAAYRHSIDQSGP